MAQSSGRPLAEILDYSASINPLGPPAGVRRAAVAALEQIDHYPELDAASLAVALEQFYALPAGSVLAGAGATEFIFLLPRALRPRRALLIEPAFSEYRPALEQAGVPVDSHVLRPVDDFRLDSQAVLAALTPETDLVWLANPLNPSGTGLGRATLETLQAELPDRVTLVVDEAFADFCPEQSLLDRVGRAANLVVLRSLTKFYAIPGLRVGFLAGPGPLVAKLAAMREPWRLSTPAIAAGHACLAEAAYRRQTLAVIPELRAALRAGLESLGCRVHASVANYLLCRLPEHGPDAADVALQLVEAGILVRCCNDFAGLDRYHLRLAVKTAENNQRLLTALAAILNGGGS